MDRLKNQNLFSVQIYMDLSVYIGAWTSSFPLKSIIINFAFLKYKIVNSTPLCETSVSSLYMQTFGGERHHGCVISISNYGVVSFAATRRNKQIVTIP